MLRSYSEGQLPLGDNLERAGVSCEMASSLGVTWSNKLVVGQSPADKRICHQALTGEQ